MYLYYLAYHTKIKKKQNFPSSILYKSSPKPKLLNSLPNIGKSIK